LVIKLDFIPVTVSFTMTTKTSNGVGPVLATINSPF